MNAAREAEIKRYEVCYRSPHYRMGDGRKKGAEQVLRKLRPGSLLDVGAGRGELRDIALRCGHSYQGVEPVSYLKKPDIVTGVATALPFPDASFDIVCCLDVLEHLLPEDVEPALLEIRRVVRRDVLLTASDKPHRFMGGDDLHISKRPVHEWQALFDRVFGEATPLGKIGVSPGWLVAL